MSRPQLLQVSAWLFLVACCLIAGIATYLQVSRRLQFSRANQQLRHSIAVEERKLQASEQQREAAVNHLLAPDTDDEDAGFLRQLQGLIAASGAHSEQIQSVPLTLLSDIRNVRPTGIVVSNEPQNDDPGRASLAHLPLNIRARSTQVVLVGTLAQVRRFLELLARYSDTTLRVNTNRMRLDRNGANAGLRAVLVMTRFIRPASTAQSAAQPQAGRR